MSIFDENQIGKNQFQTIFKKYSAISDWNYHPQHRRKHWSEFRSDLTSPSPFSPDLAKRARGPLKGSGAWELKRIEFYQFRKMAISRLWQSELKVVCNENVATWRSWVKNLNLRFVANLIDPKTLYIIRPTLRNFPGIISWGVYWIYNNLLK